MPTAMDLLDALWQIFSPTEEEAGLAWMTEKLLERNRLVFLNDDEVRDWALKETDLEEPG